MSKISESIYFSNTTLDTLEVTAELFKSKTHESHYRQAIRKRLQVEKLKLIIDVTSIDRVKAYWKTYHCNRIILQDGKQLKGSLCRKRWCSHCNRIKTAELIQGYKEPLIGFNDLHFVTLTAPTVEARQLRSEIKKRYKAFKRVKDNLRKSNGISIHGIRKTEITFSKGKYHPHFHLIIQGKKEAQLVQSLWLKQFPKAGIQGQDIRPIDTSDSNNLVEVFKYATKDVTKDTTTAKAMDVIYRSLEGIRTIQTYGSIKKYKEPKETRTEITEADWIDSRQEIWIYDEVKADYLNAYNEKLIGTETITEALEEA